MRDGHQYAAGCGEEHSDPQDLAMAAGVTQARKHGVQTPVAKSCTVITQFNEPGETCNNLPIPATALGTTLSSTPSDNVTRTSAALLSTNG